jgi:hypothetical protein
MSTGRTSKAVKHQWEAFRKEMKTLSDLPDPKPSAPVSGNGKKRKSTAASCKSLYFALKTCD